MSMAHGLVNERIDADKELWYRKEWETWISFKDDDLESLLAVCDSWKEEETDQ